MMTLRMANTDGKMANARKGLGIWRCWRLTYIP